MRIFLAALLVLTLVACARPATPVTGRWYSEEQVIAGAPLYQTYCASCHAADGSATAEWRTPGADGIYPPPPLNGTAHTWHHPLEMLDFTIVNGGAEYGGVMPGFGEVLEEAERLSIVAWFQSLWTDDIYGKWLEIEQRD